MEPFEFLNPQEEEINTRLLNGTRSKKVSLAQFFLILFPPFPSYSFPLTPPNYKTSSTCQHSKSPISTHIHLSPKPHFWANFIHINTMAARVAPKMTSLMGSASVKVARPLNLGAQRTFTGKLFSSWTPCCHQIAIKVSLSFNGYRYASRFD